jgi:DNA transposition AAA+ family ATPase
VDDGFVVTKEYRRFVEFCDACRRDRYIGLCYGPPGVGKTISARHYARWDVVEPQVRQYHIGSGRSSEAVAAKTVVYTPMVANTPRMVDKELVNLSARLNYLIEDTLADGGEDEEVQSENGMFAAPRYAEVQHVELVIVDEADRLRMPASNSFGTTTTDGSWAWS